MIRILGVLWIVVRFIITGRKGKKGRWIWYTLVVQPVDSKGIPKRSCPKCGQEGPVLREYNLFWDELTIRYNKKLDRLKAGCHRCKARWFERTEDWKNRSY